MQPVYETVEALILELTRYRSIKIIMKIAHSFKSHTKIAEKKLHLITGIYLYSSPSKIAEKKVAQKCIFRSEGGSAPGEWSESSYKLAIRSATLVRV